jgi:hypothetical protein
MTFRSRTVPQKTSADFVFEQYTEPQVRAACFDDRNEDGPSPMTSITMPPARMISQRRVLPTR